MNSILFLSSSFHHVETPILILSRTSGVYINHCLFKACTNTAVKCDIESGTVTQNNNIYTECISINSSNGFDIKVADESLCSVNQISACTCICEESKSYGNFISSEAMITNANFSYNTAKWEPSIKIFPKNQSLPASFLYSLIIRCRCVNGDTVFSLYSKSSVIRQISFINFTVSYTTTAAYIINSIVDSSNFWGGLMSGFLKGRGILKNCWISSLEIDNAIIINDSININTEIKIISVAPLIKQSNWFTMKCLRSRIFVQLIFS